MPDVFEEIDRHIETIQRMGDRMLVTYLQKHRIEVLGTFNHPELGRLVLVVSEYIRAGLHEREIEMLPLRWEPIREWLGY